MSDSTARVPRLSVTPLALSFAGAEKGVRSVVHRGIQEIVGVFGQPVAGNPTQYIMEKAFAKAGLDWRYLTLEVPPEGLADAIRGMRAMGFRGCNLTIPHKVTVVPLLDRLSDAAKLMGAVNCVQRVEDELIGENTDGKGFVESLSGVIDPAGKNVVLLGAGGAARAIAIENRAGRRAAIHDRQSLARARRRTGQAAARPAELPVPGGRLGGRLQRAGGHGPGGERHFDRPVRSGRAGAIEPR